MTLLISD